MGSEMCIRDRKYAARGSATSTIAETLSYKYQTYLKTSESLFFMVKEFLKIVMTKYAKIAFIAEKGVFPYFCYPRKLFT